MNHSTARLPLGTWMAALALAGCVSAPPNAPAEPPASPVPASPQAPSAAPQVGAGLRYRCEQDLAISVLLASDSATVDAGPRGKEVLLRDAGGLTPQHTVFSNARLRAEFGVGPDGREALLHWLQPQPQSLRCTRAV